MNHTYITLAACLFFTAGMPPQSIDEVLRQIEQNNKELQSQQHATRAAQLEGQTQNNLEDPSVEYSPFYTKSITGMSSSELVVKQGFDFPTCMQHAAVRESCSVKPFTVSMKLPVAIYC